MLPHPSDVVEEQRPAGDERQDASKNVRTAEKLFLDAAQPSGEANDPADRRATRCSLGIAVEARRELHQASPPVDPCPRVGSVPHSLEHRPVRDPLAIRKTTPPRHQCAVGDVLTELRTRRDFPTPGAPRRVKSWHERSPLPARRRRGVDVARVRPDHRRVKNRPAATSATGRTSRRAGVRSPASRRRRRHEDPPGALVHETCPATRLLEPNRRLHRVTGSKRPITTRDDEHFPGSDTHAELERGAPACQELGSRDVSRRSRISTAARAAAARRPRGPPDPEHRGDRAAHRALDGGAVSLEYGEELVEAPRGQLAQRLGVELPHRYGGPRKTARSPSFAPLVPVGVGEHEDRRPRRTAAASRGRPSSGSCARIRRWSSLSSAPGSSPSSSESSFAPPGKRPVRRLADPTGRARA